MKLQPFLFSAIVALSISDAASAHAGVGRTGAAAPADRAALSVDPLTVSDDLQDAIDAAYAALQPGMHNVGTWEVDPVATAAQVFSSPDALLAIVGQDIQLPWRAAGEINRGALANLLGAQAGLIDQITAEADSRGGGFRLGAYTWSHPTAPDVCSGETLYLMYFERTGLLFSFRFDASSEC